MAIGLRDLVWALRREVGMVIRGQREGFGELQHF